MRSASPGETSAAEGQAGNERLLLALLLLVAMLNLVDRQVLNILAEPIKHDLELSDTQLGLLTGPAFAIFYALVGLPTARFADRPSTDRVTLIASVLAIWSLLTAASGFVQSYAQLVLARIGIGLGEAGAAPASYSLIADGVPVARRSRAVAIQGLGVPLGMLVGLAVGGIVADALGWRAAFLVVGLPGLLLALLLRLLLKDPRRVRASAPAATAPPQVGWREGLQALGRSRAFVLLTSGIASGGIVSMGISAWIPVLLIRDYGLSPGQVGLSLGLVSGIAGGAGMLIGGAVADRLAAASPAHYATVPLLGAILTPAFYLAALLSGPLVPALCFIGLATAATMMFYGPIFATVPRLAGMRFRSFASAMVLLFYNLVGLGVGPLAIGAASDLLASVAGDQQLRCAMMACTSINLLAIWCFWRARRRLEEELDPAEARQA